MKALITGANGQVGQALQSTAPPGVSLLAFGSAELDITCAEAVTALVEAERPDLIFNTAAYTAVDKAESEEARAQLVNGDAVGFLVGAAQQTGARLIHISTDFAFDGTASTPYLPDAPPSPLGAYGRSKVAGEVEAKNGALVVRTAWVYGSHGHNFVRTMLRLMAERDEVRVVADQIGTPTWATSLADALWRMADSGSRGIWHYTDSGVASWYDFAVAIQEEALALGLLDRAVPVIPISTADFPTPARRPAYSVLDKSATFALLGEAAPHWRVNLRKMLKDIQAHG